MPKKLKIPTFKNLDEEMDFYANIDLHTQMRDATPEEEAELDRSLGIQRRKTTLTAKGRARAHKKPGRKAS